MNENTTPAQMVSEYATVRDRLWTLIAVCKEIAPAVPLRERIRMIDAAMRAEEALK